MNESLMRDAWERMSSQEREDEARKLAKELPSEFKFSSVRGYGLGGVENDVAEYSAGAAAFVLLPGGEFQVGYDNARPWQPTPAEQQSWQDTADEYGIDRSIQEHIAAVTLRPRLVRLPPLLVETRTSEFGWEAVPTDDPEVIAIVRAHLREKREGEVRIYQKNNCFRVSRDEAGELHAFRSQATTHAALTAELRQSGFRLLTSDEWEYACGAGSPTLFRWGDHAPADRYPIDGRLDEESRGEGSLSSQEIQTGEFDADWNLHFRRNALGIFIARNPYSCELVAEPDITRGGDGGSMICGGAGFFMGWLSLATAYFEAELCECDPDESIIDGYTFARRVLPLD